MIDFLKLFKEATFLTSAGNLFQSAGAAAAVAKEQAPSVGSTFCIGRSSRVLSVDLGLTETVNSLESEKQDLELNSLCDR